MSISIPIQELGTGISYFDSTTHRKIRYYRMFLDALDANGHGTHCAGSVMGYPQSGTIQLILHSWDLPELSACEGQQSSLQEVEPCFPEVVAPFFFGYWAAESAFRIYWSGGSWTAGT